jgi:predicted nuclease with TOPRIM domain
LERETELITEVNRVNGKLDKVNRMHQKLKRLLERETELITEVNRVNGELDEVNRMHQELNEELRKSKGAVNKLRNENEMLEAILSRRTHKAADAAANAILHVPGAKRLLARRNP